MIGITFDSYDMQANGVTVTDTDIFSAPKRRVDDVTLAESDGSIIITTHYEPKRSRIEGYLQAPTAAALRQLIDTFHRNLNKQGVNLDVTEEDGTVRRYVATTTNVAIARPSGLNYASFSVEVLIPSGVGSDTTQQLLASTLVTTTTAEIPITIAGSYKGEPYITVTLGAVSGGANATLTIQNAGTLRGMIITRSWAAGDILEIDVAKQEVYVNNLPVEYAGVIPSWQPGLGIISYVDSFSSRSALVEAVHTPRYL